MCADLDVPIDNRAVADMGARADLDVVRDEGAHADTHLSADHRVLPEDTAREHGMDVGATALPPLQLRGRTHPIDIYCVPLESRMQVSASPVTA